ncbi:hypothetical protein [uncultured Sphaerochaeta sp.]|uniref:hypothetical protein n=1 Tax=uncultured Sphaerochaeta sp. TaxID=886478 RepID=UPI002A0A8B32|nr:hypothetical protein [uncultured Sphaerochaeta sp.]
MHGVYGIHGQGIHIKPGFDDFLAIQEAKTMNESDRYYDREKLYEEVWAEPVYKVAKRYGVSNVAIAKTCRKMLIPLPEPGYWNKMQSGQKLKKTPLPKVEKYPKVKKTYFRPPSEDEQKERVHLVPEAFEIEKQILDKEKLPGMEVDFDPEIKITNKYVLNTKRGLEKSCKHATNEYGRCSSDIDENFMVSIGPDNIKRVLAILQTLCDELEKRGYSVGTKPEIGSKDSETQNSYPERVVNQVYAIIMDTYIPFWIMETSKKIELSEEERKKSYQKYKYVPSGRLSLELSNNPSGSHAWAKWHDGKKRKIEDQLHDIIINMIKRVAATKEQQACWRMQEDKYRIEEERRKAQERLARMEKARVENLGKEADRLVRFKQMKEYIEVVSTEGKKRLGATYSGSDFAKWVEWAESYLLQNGPDTWELPEFEILDKPWYF